MKSSETMIIPEPSLRRLPLYHQILELEKENGIEYISCSKIAEMLRFTSIQVRKDLSYIDLSGTPKKGYKLNELKEKIEEFLGWDRMDEAFLVGTGNLGKALMSYSEFKNKGLTITAAFDKNHKVTGTTLFGIPVFDISKLQELAYRMKTHIGIITVPAPEAQKIADIMVRSGIRGIWNFAPVRLTVPQDIIVSDVNLSSYLAVLSQKLK